MSVLHHLDQHRFWRAWARKAMTDLGALLAETIDTEEPFHPDIREARRLMIQAEALLAGTAR